MSNTGWYEKLQASLEVLQTGKEIINPEKWKAGKQILGNLVIFLSACVILMNQFNCSFCDINVSEETLTDIASGALGVYALIVNIITAITSKRSTLNLVENVKILSNTSDMPDYVTEIKWDGKTNRRKNVQWDGKERRLKS